MDLGVVLQTDPPASRVIELAKMAETQGFTHAWTFDSVVLWQEPFVIYSQILAQTERIIVGPMVTNPTTRNWTVTASLFATLNEMFASRTICGIGRGDSAVRVIGGRPASLETLEQAMNVIKRLANGKEVDYNGTAVSIPWVTSGNLEIWMGAYGPKALDLVGRQADGLILQLADPLLVRWSIEAVRHAAEKAGRDPAELSICVAAPAYVGSDLDHQRNQVRWFGGMVGNHVADLVSRYGTGSSIPTALTDYIQARQGYDYGHHGKAGNPTTDFVPDAIIDRFCVLGPIERHVERMEELAELGVDQFAIYLMHDNQEATLQAYGKEVIPNLSSRSDK